MDQILCKCVPKTSLSSLKLFLLGICCSDKRKHKQSKPINRVYHFGIQHRLREASCSLLCFLPLQCLQNIVDFIFEAIYIIHRGAQKAPEEVKFVYVLSYSWKSAVLYSDGPRFFLSSAQRNVALTRAPLKVRNSRTFHSPRAADSARHPHMTVKVLWLFMKPNETLADVSPPKAAWTQLNRCPQWGEHADL